ncbi:trigger factor [bacterium]|nr:trigger factor [bacterium]
MKIEIKKLPKSEIEIKTIIPWEKWKGFLDLAVADISKNVKIKGFRPGKAPKEMVEQEAGKDAILNKAVQKAIQKNYPKILADEKIEAIGAPEVEVLKVAEGNDLEYKIKTAVMPKIKLSPWQKSVKKINQEHQNVEVEVMEKEVEKELKKLAHSRVKSVTVNREARQKDSVEINFQVFRDGVPIENGTGKKHNLILGSGAFIPGFEDNIIGMKRGDKKEFELEFPKEYRSGDLAGKKAEFKVEMNLVQERIAPLVNDEFASSLGKFKNLEELKKSLKEGMKKEKERQIKEKRRAEFTEKLIEKTEVELPEILIQEEIKKMMAEFESQVRSMGMEPVDYLKQIKKTEQDLRKDWKLQAVKRIKAALALSQVAKDRNIKVSSEEVEEEMNKTLSRHGDRKNLEKTVDLKKLYSYAEGMLVNERVFEVLEKM